MYFVLDRSGALNPCRWIMDYPYIKKVKWSAGRRHSEPIPDPLELSMIPMDPNSADHGPEIPEYFKGKIPVMRDDLIGAMHEAGVDNLDLYNVVLIDPANGARHTTHKAVNIIGAVSAADMEKSEATVHTGGPVIDVDFDSLVVDEPRARGALIFRLAESTNAILVHERLRDHLVARGFTKLRFLDPRECAL